MSTLTTEERAMALGWLKTLAAQYPQQRIMQIVFNALDDKGIARDPSGRPRDFFYVTDAQFLEAMRDAINNPT